MVSSLLPDLWVGVTDANFRLLGKIELFKELFTSICNLLENKSILSFIIRTGMSWIEAALVLSKDEMRFAILFKGTSWNLNASIILEVSEMLLMLGWSLYLSKEFNIGSLIFSFSCGKMSSIFRFSTAAKKKPLKWLAISWSSFIILSSIIRVID